MAESPLAQATSSACSAQFLNDTRFPNCSSQSVVPSQGRTREINSRKKWAAARRRLVAAHK